MTKFNNAVMCMVLDPVTGQPERVPPTHNTLVPREDAEAFVGRFHGWGHDVSRMLIVKLACLIPEDTTE